MMVPSVITCIQRTLWYVMQWESGSGRGHMMQVHSCCCRGNTPGDLVIVPTLGCVVADMCCKMALGVLHESDLTEGTQEQV